MLRVNRALLVGAAALMAGVMATPALAQQATSVTGCLSKGTDKDSYTITGSDGKSYSLTSTSVKLDQHVGHKVTVTGTSAGMETGAIKDTTMAKMDTAMKMDTTKGAGMKKETGKGGGTLNVSDLKMVSAQWK
jgi:hypothetical protein